MNLYIVQKTGVYDQGIYGVFDTQAKAEGACRFYALNDVDDYHAWWVNRVPLGVRCREKKGVDCEMFRTNKEEMTKDRSLTAKKLHAQKLEEFWNRVLNQQ